MSVNTLIQDLRDMGLFPLVEAAELLELSKSTLEGWRKQTDNPYLQQFFHKVEGTGRVFFNVKLYKQELLDSARKAVEAAIAKAKAAEEAESTEAQATT